MKKFLFTFLVAMSAALLVATDADAKRLGGGGSIGRQAPSYSRQAAPTQQYNQPSQARPATPPATPQQVPPKPASPWRNILGGALLGLGLGALFSHLGFGGAFGSILGTILMFGLLLLAVTFLMRLFSRKGGTGPREAYSGGYGEVRTPEIGSRIEPQVQPAAFQAEQPVAGGTAAPPSIPPGFDTQGFLRHAKTYFIRLQAAWDKADINDIREFTTPEMFGELRLQLQERGASPNVTDVVSLDADLLGVETTDRDYLASVRFSGMIKEAENAPAEPFAEIWNLSKPLNGQGGWVLAGIQQLS
jgi:predicted lipid-binding transport protein (Tim44 family)